MWCICAPWPFIFGSSAGSPRSASHPRLDPPRDRDQFFGVGAVFHQHRHFERLLVVHDHVLHEGNIGSGVAGLREFGGLLGGQRLARLPRRAGLHDRHILRQSEA
jgi:hypothetical protein